MYRIGSALLHLIASITTSFADSLFFFFSFSGQSLGERKKKKDKHYCRLKVVLWRFMRAKGVEGRQPSRSWYEGLHVRSCVFKMVQR